jgi:hypothetical protein
MSSRRLETISKDNPELAARIQQVREYVEWQKERNVHEIVPRVVAVKLGTSEADALSLLMLFEDAGVLKHKYELICVSNSATIASYDSLEEVPNEHECRYCDREHGGDELRLELVFEIVQKRNANAAA